MQYTEKTFRRHRKERRYEKDTAAFDVLHFIVPAHSLRREIRSGGGDTDTGRIRAGDRCGDGLFYR